MKIKRKVDKSHNKLELQLILYSVFEGAGYEELSLKELPALSKQTYRRYLSELIGVGLLEDIYFRTLKDSSAIVLNSFERESSNYRYISGCDLNPQHREKLLRCAELVSYAKSIFEYDYSGYLYELTISPDGFNPKKTRYLSARDFYENMNHAEIRKACKTYYESSLCSNQAFNERTWQRDMKAVFAVMPTVAHLTFTDMESAVERIAGTFDCWDCPSGWDSQYDYPDD